MANIDDDENSLRSASPRIFGMMGSGVMPLGDGDIEFPDQVHFAGFYRGISLPNSANRDMLLHVYNANNARLV